MESLKHFYKFVNELTKNNSRNYKIEVIKKYANDEYVKYYLHFLFNPYIVTGISDKKLNKEVIGLPSSIHNFNVIELLEYLKVNNTGSDETIKVINYTKSTLFPEPKTLLDVELLELLDKIITKNLILGIDGLTINKCIPALIPAFNVQLANKYFDKPEIVEGKSFALTTKIDGGRIIALKENGEVSFWTRAGQRYEGLVDLEQEMREKLPDNICLDGEITLLDPQGLTSKDQYKATMKITRKLGEKHGVKMLVFDCMTAEEFRNQYCPDKYFIRRANLISIFDRLYCAECVEEGNRFAKQTLKNYPFYPEDKEEYDNYSIEFRENLINFLNTKYTYFKILPILYQGNDTSKITEWLNYNVDRGEEGIMINLLDGLYEFKRTSNLLKVKRFNSCDLKIVGFESGTNKFANTLGAVLLEYKDNIVKCGSGFTEEQRNEIWNNKDKYFNTIIEISYFEETQNSDGGISLRFPTFKDFRPDKLESNY